MTTLTSTIPGAVSVLQGHFNTVASNNPSLDIGVYVGQPIEGANNNFLLIGDLRGNLLTGYRQDWAGLPGFAERKDEHYGILCSLRAWAGDSGVQSPTDRLADAFTIFDGVMGQIQGDIQASNSLTPSGSWQVTDFGIPVSGPLGGSGWGVLCSFTVSTKNIRLTS